jgi:hypothetical protein
MNYFLKLVLCHKFNVCLILNINFHLLWEVDEVNKMVAYQWTCGDLTIIAFIYIKLLCQNVTFIMTTKILL